MKIVIDIPENDYELALRNDYSTIYKGVHIAEAIKKGTLLPKGHGDLVDRDDLLEYTDINICAYTPTINRYDIITTPTIIEADKAESEE